jgi:hypothetical protein
MGNHRSLGALGAGIALALLVTLATPASAVVTPGDTEVSCANTKYATAKFDSYWHRTSGATSFWNDGGSTKQVDVKTVNGTKVNYALDLVTGDYQAWSSANSPIGFWSLYNKPDKAYSGGTTFHLDFSYVHKPA